MQADAKAEKDNDLRVPELKVQTVKIEAKNEKKKYSKVVVVA